MMKPSPMKNEDLAELDRLLGIQVARGLEDEEERVAVDLELRPLVCLDRVLDRQLVQLELPAYGVELLRRRLVDADPDESVVMP